MTSECQCPSPVESINPRHRGSCVKCSGRLATRWTSNDATVKEFYDRLEESLFPLGVLTAPLPSERLRAFREFRAQAEVRELAGRRKFGLSHLRRDNPREATEEYADGSNYMLFDILSARRAGKEPDWNLALSSAHHAFQAWQYAIALRGHRHRPFSEGVAS